MGPDYITLEEAAGRSGLHPNSLKRLLRQGKIRGFKATEGGRRRWLVSVASLRQYTDPLYGFALERSGPKLFLRKVRNDTSEEST